MPVRSTLLGAVIGLAALVTAFGFAASLNHLLTTPRLVGWNWSGTIGDDFDGSTITFKAGRDLIPLKDR